MHLADHIRPLLRDHDCVIIPDFGGLVADVSPARAQPGRQALSPPTKLVAFNQALTRNDGLLVDALSQHTGLSIAQAREAVRTAVAGLQQELDDTNRTELPGIGIFRRAAGRGLAFEYTGTDNLLAAAFGLPELAARPVRSADARPKRPQPALRGAGTRRSRWTRLLPGGLVAVAAGLLLLANYQVGRNGGLASAGWKSPFPRLEWAPSPAAPAPQQATFQHDFSEPSIASEGITPLEVAPPAPAATPDSTLTPTPGEPAALTVATAAPAAASATTTAAAEAPATTEPAAAPLSAKPAPVPAAVASVAPTATPAAPAKAAPKAAATASATTIKTRTGRYYVIAGAYSTLAHAEQGRKVLAKTGHPARIILPPFGSRLYRLTAADYPDLASALREAQRLRVSTRCDYNTLKF